MHVSTGGNTAFVSLPADRSADRFDEHLQRLRLAAVTLRGNAPLWCGLQSRPKIVQAVKDVLDPDKRFPSLDD